MRLAYAIAAFLLVLVVVLGMKWRAAATELEQMKDGTANVISDSLACTERLREMAGKLFDVCTYLHEVGRKHPVCANDER